MIIDKKSNNNSNLNLDFMLDKYQLSTFITTKSNIKRARLLNYTSFHSESYVYDVNGTGPTLTATGANSRIKIFQNNHLRKLSPLENFRYMGFKDEAYKNCINTNLLSDNQLTFMCGNSICVPVLEAIFKTLRFK